MITERDISYEKETAKISEVFRTLDVLLVEGFSVMME